MEFSRKAPSISARAAESGAPWSTGERSPWSVIFGVGGLCWLVVTGTALLWTLPTSGTLQNGEYVVSTGARAAQHALVFGIAAVGYRLAVALGWPSSAMARVRVVLVNVLLALAVLAWSDAAVGLAGGFVDGHFADMRDTFVGLRRLLLELHCWAAPLRFFLPPYVLGLCAIALVRLSERQHREALRSAQLAGAYAAARMAILSAQLQPHFLFNSLNAIMGLIDESPRQASTMLARLGDFLRHVLETSHSPWVQMVTELGGLEAYLAVQQARFSSRLSVVIDASPQALDTYVPSLLLQPLAENAIEHGRDGGGSSLRVRVAISVLDERLCIMVNNSSPQLRADLSPADYGRGLSNVELRLRAAYAGEARLTVGPDRIGGTTAILDLPVRRVVGSATVESA